MSERFARTAALVIIVVAVSFTIRHNIFVPWGTDSAAYLTAARDWARGEIFRPAEFVQWARWAVDGFAESAHGNAPGAVPGTIVGVYPLGYPLLLAAALKLGGSWAPYCAAPLALGLLAWCMFVLGCRLSSHWAGLAAALLIATSPVTFANAVMPMSDVPAAALWGLAWVMALRPGLGAAAASGCAIALAVMIRPNLAPIGGVIAAVVFAVGDRHRWKRLVILTVTAAIGPAVLLWSQAVLYGHPLRTGYHVIRADMFNASRAWVNLEHYPRLLRQLHGPLSMAGLLAVGLILRPVKSSGDRERRVIVLSAAAMVAVNLVLYLPYPTFHGWVWLRFMLPALAALFVLLAGLCDQLRLALPARLRWAGAAAFLPVAVTIAPVRGPLEQLVREEDNYKRIQLMGQYLAEVLPVNAVILSDLQGGAAAFYTNRPIVRYSMLEPHMLDRAIAELARRRYRPVIVIDEAMERSGFKTRFQGSVHAALDWWPRAQFFAFVPMSFYDPADRDSFLSGDRWPIDVVKWPADAPYDSSEVLARAPMEIALPGQIETRQFRWILEEKYRTALGRPSSPTFTDPDQAVRWLRRYLRYRLHGCNGDQALSRILDQLAGGPVPPVCGGRPTTAFPGRDEVVSFRRRLETTFAQTAQKPGSTTYVDLEGDAIWTQEYIRFRVGGCSPAAATAAVLAEIEGRPAKPDC